MKRAFALILAAAVLCGFTSFRPALSEETGKHLEMAFGLFSVEIPADAEAGPNTGNALSDLRYEVSGFPHLVYANFAPIGEYDQGAARKLNSYISLMYALCGGDYTETEVAEETLPGGVSLRWQLMRGSVQHALWFEAFTDDFGYNLCLYGAPTQEQDQAMISLMRSFRADAQREKDLMEIRQTREADGSFVSAEHGLKIKLDDAWNPVMLSDMLLPQTAFALEKGGGRWLIQLMYTMPVSPENTKDLLTWFLQSYRGNSGEPYPVTLEGLGGVEAWVSDQEADVFIRNVAFVYQGYGYYGSFMWIKPDDETARPYMDAALKSLSAGNETE